MQTAKILGGATLGGVGTAELWDKINNPDRETSLTEGIATGKLGWNDTRGAQGIVNALLGAGGGAAIGMGGLSKGLVPATAALGAVPLKDLAINANRNLEPLAGSVSGTADSSKLTNLLLGGLGLGALGLGGLGIWKYMTKKDPEDKARIRYKLQGKAGDPSTQAEIEMPVESPEFSAKMREGLNMGIRRQVGKSIKYNSLKRDPETGRLISYELWKAKYGEGEKAASEDIAMKQVNAPKPDYKVVVHCGKCHAESCDTKTLSISEAYNAVRAAMGMDGQGSVPNNLKKEASVFGTALSALGGSTMGLGAANMLMHPEDSAGKYVLAGGAGLGLTGLLTSWLQERNSTPQEPPLKDDGTIAGIQSYANVGSMPAGFHGIPNIDDDAEDKGDDELEAEEEKFAADASGGAPQQGGAKPGEVATQQARQDLPQPITPAGTANAKPMPAIPSGSFAGVVAGVKKDHQSPTDPNVLGAVQNASQRVADSVAAMHNNTIGNLGNMFKQEEQNSMLA